MEVTLNSEKHTIDDNSSVANLIARLYDTDKGMAVAVNNTLIPRDKWHSHKLADNDDVIIIKAAYGG